MHIFIYEYINEYAYINVYIYTNMYTFNCVYVQMSVYKSDYTQGDSDGAPVRGGRCLPQRHPPGL